MHGPHGRLDGEGEEEGDEDPPLRADPELGTHQRVDEVGLLPARAEQAERDDADEHDEPRRQRVDEELHRGVAPPDAAVAADEEVHRHEHRLEDDVEEEHVACGEDGDHQRLEHEHEGDETGLAPSDVRPFGHDLLLPPAGEQRERHEEDGEPRP